MVYNAYERFVRNEKKMSRSFNKLIEHLKKNNNVKRINNKLYEVKIKGAKPIKVKLSTTPLSTPPYKQPVIWIGSNFSINEFDLKEKIPEAKKYINLLKKSQGFTQKFLDAYTKYKVKKYSKGKAKIIDETKDFVVIKLPDGTKGIHHKTIVDYVGIDPIKTFNLKDYHKSYRKQLEQLLSRQGLSRSNKKLKDVI